MKRFIIPDIHGELELLQSLIENILEKDPNPELIFLGDYVDRGPDSCGVLQYLNFELSRKVKCVFIRGNHDEEFLQYLRSGSQLHSSHPFYYQGFKETVDSYERAKISVDYHIPFLEDTVPYYIFEQDGKKHIAVHGGFFPYISIEEHPDLNVFWWDRDLLETARYCHLFNRPLETFDNFERIYVGHTPVQCYDESMPQLWCNLWAMDTGVGKLKNVNLWGLDVETQTLI